MHAARALALFGALLASSSRASADEVLFVERARIQGGVISEHRPAPRDRVDDLHVEAIPELALLWGTPTSQLSLTCTATGALHSTYSSELGNRLAFAGAFQLSPRTTLLVGASAARTTLNNLFLTQPPGVATTGLFPSTSTSTVSANVTQGIAHDLSPRVRVDQQATASGFKTLAPTPPLTSFFASVGGGIERVWSVDALGVGALVGVSSAQATPPVPDQSFLVFTVGPRWRHDWSSSLSTLVTAGVSVLESMTHESDPLWAPSARASALYTTDDTVIDLAVSTGLTPNPLTGQMVRAHDVTIHGITPLSLPAHLYLEASAGYVRGELIDRLEPGRDLAYHSVLSDVALLWQVGPHVQLFARYTFIGQWSDAPAAGASSSFLRDSYLVGVSLSSRPAVMGGAGRGAVGEQVPAAFPQRVDRSDGGPRAAPAAQQPDAPAAD